MTATDSSNDTDKNSQSQQHHQHRRNAAIERRSAARMLAVQAIYQRDFLNDGNSGEKLYQQVMEQLQTESEFDEPEFTTNTTPDKKFFHYLISGVCGQNEEITNNIEQALGKRWTNGRLTALMKSILQVAALELLDNKVHKNTIINEYVNITAGFYGNPELGLVNGILQELADKLHKSE